MINRLVFIIRNKLVLMIRNRLVFIIRNRLVFIIRNNKFDDAKKLSIITIRELHYMP